MDREEEQEREREALTYKDLTVSKKREAHGPAANFPP